MSDKCTFAPAIVLLKLRVCLKNHFVKMLVRVKKFLGIHRTSNTLKSLAHPQHAELTKRFRCDSALNEEVFYSFGMFFVLLNKICQNLRHGFF